MSESSTSPTVKRREPRDLRVGGYAISLEEAKKWTMRLYGLFSLSAEEIGAVADLINEKIRQDRLFKGFTLRTVGDDEFAYRYMAVTQSAAIRNAYAGMPTEEIPQFQPNEIDEKVRKFLDTQGFEPGAYIFETLLY